MINIRQLFQKYRIQFIDRGKNCSRGNVNLQCPFCGKSWQTLMELEKEYGRDRLRFVYKHFPLPFHDDALPSARVAQAVFELKGAEAFRDFVSKVFELRGNLSDDNLRALADSMLRSLVHATRETPGSLEAEFVSGSCDSGWPEERGPWCMAGDRQSPDVFPFDRSPGPVPLRAFIGGVLTRLIRSGWPPLSGW